MKKKLTYYVTKFCFFIGLLFTGSAVFGQPATPATCTAVIGSPANGAQHHITISWAASGGATSYTLEASPDNNTWSIISSGTAATSYDHNASPNGNLPFYYRVSAVNGSGASAPRNCTQFPIYTACDNPELPILSNATSNSITVQLVPETPVANSATTTYSVFCTSTNQYIQANGTLGAPEVYQTRAAWGTIIVTGLSTNTSYCFYAKAKNNDGDVRYPFAGLLPLQTFDAANSIVLTGSTSATNVWWSPGTTTSGTKFSWMSTGGCSGGVGGGNVGFAGSFTNFFGDFIRTPATNCTGNSSVVLNFDISHSYVASHIVSSPTNSDAARFYMWVDNGYKQCSSIKINGVEVSSTDGNGKWLKFDVARNCVNVDVTFDLSTSTNLTNILFYLEAHDPYNNSGAFSVNFDNISIQGVSGACISTVNCTSPAMPGAITGSTTPCDGSAQTYSITPVNGATSYTWTLPNGWSGSSTTTSINATSGANSGNITVTASNSCGTSSASTLPINVVKVPAAPVNLGGPNPACTGGSATYSAPVVSGATSYTWTLPNGWTGSSTTNSITVTPGANGGTISLQAVNTCGSSTLSSLPVTVLPPATTPGPITGDTIQCSGKSGTYSVVPVSGATSYTWTLPNGWTGSSTTNSINPNFGGSGTGTISVTANSICGSSAASSITVVTKTAPVAPGAINGPSAVCFGDSVTYSIAPVAGADSYTWTLPNGWTGSSATTSINAGNITSAGNIYVSANAYCGASADVMKSITVNPLPQATATTSSNTICSNDSAEVCVTGGTFTAYQWNTGETTACIQVKAAGNYYVTVADANNCVAQSGSVSVGVYPVPSVSIVVTGDTLSSFGATAYQWFYEGQPINGATGQTYVAATPGNYAVQITDSNGCKALSNPVSVTITGMDDLNVAAIKVYPNPLVNGPWQLRVDAEMAGSQVEVYDATGRLVYSGIVSSQFTEIAVNTAPGLYTLRLVYGGKVVLYKKLVRAQ